MDITGGCSWRAVHCRIFVSVGTLDDPEVARPATVGAHPHAASG
jgi:hypothetical protein